MNILFFTLSFCSKVLKNCNFFVQSPRRKTHSSPLYQRHRAPRVSSEEGVELGVVGDVGRGGGLVVVPAAAAGRRVLLHELVEGGLLRLGLEGVWVRLERVPNWKASR